MPRSVRMAKRTSAWVDSPLSREGRISRTPIVRKCVFCDHPATLTKEHIWAEWVRDFIPRDPRAPDRALHTTGLSWVDENGQWRSTMNVKGNLARPGEMMEHAA